MPNGGKRSGAGAPKGNFNAIKNGARSRQFRYALHKGTMQEWRDVLSRMQEMRGQRSLRDH
jgi:hypothetical protein